MMNSKKMIRIVVSSVLLVAIVATCEGVPIRRRNRV